MNTRREFLTLGAAASASALTSNSPLFAAQTQGPKATSVQQATMKVLFANLKRMSDNHSFNPFATGQLAMMARYHFGAMEDSGHNAKVTAAIRSSGVSPLTPDRINSMLAGMKKHGINFGSDANSFLLDALPSAANSVGPKITASLNSGHSIIKVQRSLHGELVRLSSPVGLTKPVSTKLHRKGKLTLVGFQETIEEDAPPADDSWADPYFSLVGDGVTEFTEIDGWEPDYTNYLAADWTSVFPTTYTTPSGNTIDLCTVYYAAVAMGAGGWAALLGAGGAEYAFGVAFVAANPELAAAILAIAAGIAAYLAVVC